MELVFWNSPCDANNCHNEQKKPSAEYIGPGDNILGCQTKTTHM